VTPTTGGVLAVGLTTTGTSDQFTLPGNGTSSAYALSSVVTAVSGSSPSATIALQVQDAAGTWRQVAALSAQTSAGGAATIVTQAAVVAALGGNLASMLTSTARIAWTVTGTTPSITAVVAATAQ
jgi:hypothetical protein